MFIKLIAIATACTVVSAGLLPASPTQQHDEFDSHPRYTFSYDVQDTVTGDVKSQTETRDGDVVQGQYALNEPDGYRRVVEYTVDGERGFNAVVRREPLDASAAKSKPAAVVLKTQTVLPQNLIAKPKLIQLQPVIKASAAQPAAALVRTIAAPTFIHSVPAARAVLHPAPVHLAPATHLVHAAPATAVIAHHAPAAVVKSSIQTPHYSYVF